MKARLLACQSARHPPLLLTTACRPSRPRRAATACRPQRNELAREKAETIKVRAELNAAREAVNAEVSCRHPHRSPVSGPRSPPVACHPPRLSSSPRAATFVLASARSPAPPPRAETHSRPRSVRTWRSCGAPCSSSSGAAAGGMPRRRRGRRRRAISAVQGAAPGEAQAEAPSEGWGWWGATTRAVAYPCREWRRQGWSSHEHELV